MRGDSCLLGIRGLFTRQGLDLEPLDGETLQKLVEEVANITPDLLAKVKAMYGG